MIKNHETLDILSGNERTVLLNFKQNQSYIMSVITPSLKLRGKFTFSGLQIPLSLPYLTLPHLA